MRTLASGSAYRATPLETASGMLRSGVLDAGPLPEVPPDTHPLDAVGSALVAAVARPPCVVSFSGGQDSSAVLAAAVAVARREGLPPPVPVTLRFDGVETSHEAAWQEDVVRHLALDDWQRVHVDDELDVVGPVAGTVLRRHGPLWPFNAHFHVPVLKHARGGSLLTGIGGDELFWRRRHRRLSLVLAGRQPFRSRDVLRAGRAVLPVSVRAAEVRWRIGFPAALPWLRPAAQRAVRRQWYMTVAREPVRFDHAVRRTWWHSRVRQIQNRSLDLLAADHDVVVTHPLQERAFIAAVMRRGGAVGYRTRGEALADIFGSMLPSSVVDRRTKATFEGVFWNRHSSAFAAAWDGSGVAGLPVDAATLKAIWSTPMPRHRLTLPLFQALWTSTYENRACPRPGAVRADRAGGGRRI